MADAYGPAPEAGGSAEVAGAGVGDVVVATDGVLGCHGHRAGGRATHDTVGTVGLVSHAGVCARAYHIGARLLRGKKQPSEKDVIKNITLRTETVPIMSIIATINTVCFIALLTM